MGTEIIAIMAGFSFGYCIMDLIQNYRTERAVDKLLKSALEDEQK